MSGYFIPTDADSHVTREVTQKLSGVRVCRTHPNAVTLQVFSHGPVALKGVDKQVNSNARLNATQLVSVIAALRIEFRDLTGRELTMKEIQACETQVLVQQLTGRRD